MMLLMIWHLYAEIMGGTTDNIVIGPIANDAMAVLFRQFENGIISFENMVNGMIYKETTNQYSFHTEKAISLLKKVGV